MVGCFDGHVAKYLGDGVLAYFGCPRSHEVDAERAVRAGLELVGAVERMEFQANVGLRARIGIATGQAPIADRHERPRRPAKRFFWGLTGFHV